MSTTHDVLVIGGGQAGLAAGYELKRARRDFVILEASDTVGSAWRTRWDSLRLFTPAEHSSLPGLRFPAPNGYCPTGPEVADYLESYATRHDLPVHTGVRVLRLARIGTGFEAITTRGTYVARSVIVATGPFQAPKRPAFASSLAPDVVQLHSHDYRRPADVGAGSVVVVGSGNSAVQIAAELAESGRDTTLCIGGRASVLPLRWMGRSIFDTLEAVGYMKVRADSRVGRFLKARQVIIGESPRAASSRTGLKLAPRAVGASASFIVAGDGSQLPARTVVWATGYACDYSWIDAPVLDDAGRPEHERGFTRVPGLMFLGQTWLHTRGSALLGWVGRDARWLVERMQADRRTLSRVAFALGML